MLFGLSHSLSFLVLVALGDANARGDQRSCRFRRIAAGEIVQAIAQRPKRRFIELAIGGDCTARMPHRRRCGGERHHGLAFQHPDQAGAVVSAQPRIGRARLSRRLVQAKQFVRCPTEGERRVTPLRQEAVSVIETLLAAPDVHVFRAFAFESIERVGIGERNRIYLFSD
jgi:hypothetical protein